MITLRFDMRIRDGGAPTADLCAAAIEMCAWAEPAGGRRARELSTVE